MSELESLAAEVGLKKAMGSGFKAARAGKKPDFITALLKVPGFVYQGTVPAVMRYPRQPILADGEEGNETDESERTETIPEQQPEPALA